MKLSIVSHHGECSGNLSVAMGNRTRAGEALGMDQG